MSQERFGVFVAIASMALLAAPGFAVAGREGPGMPASRANVDLIANLRVHDAGENHIRGVSTLGNYAYLGASEEPLPVCSLPGGVYVVDVSDPRTPREVAFIPSAPASVPYHGVHALHVDTPSFTGDVLVHVNEICPAATPGFATALGGISLWDVTNPRSPTPLALGVGDTDPLPGVPARAHRSRYASAWDAGDRAFVLMSDAEEPGVGDVDVIEITDPRNPRRIAEAGLASWPAAQNAQSAGIGAQPAAAMAGVRVRSVGGSWLALVAYQDAGQVVLNVSDPANLAFVEDSDYPDPDPLTRLPPEGNATRGDWDRTGRLIVAGDSDTFPYRLVPRITSGPFSGEEFRAVPGTATRPITRTNPLAGPTYFLGLACSPVPAAASPDAIALIERGTCTFQIKFDNMRAAGYQGGIVMNSTVAGNGCEVYAVLGAAGDRPFILVARSTGYRILGIAGYDPARCRTGPNPPLPPSGTRGSSVSVTSEFDGWGYVRLLDAGSLTQLGAYAPSPLLDERYADGFGTLSLNEVIADPTHELAYSSWYSAGFRVLSFSGGSLREVGHFTGGVGGDFLGVDVHVKPDGRRYVLAAERDSGLSIFRYGTDMRVRTRSRPAATRVRTIYRVTSTISNRGTISTTAAVYRSRLPAGVSFVSASSTQGRCGYRRSTRIVVCSLGRVAEDASSAFVTIRLRAIRPGTKRVRASITAAEVDYDPRNNRSSVQTTVTSQPIKGRLTGGVG